MHTNLPAPQDQHQGERFDPLKFQAKRRLRLELEASGQDQKPLAIEARVDDAKVTRWLHDKYVDDLPAYKVPAITRQWGPGFMEWLAIQCGGVYHHGEQVEHLRLPAVALVGLLARESGCTVQQLIQDLEDMHWSPDEKQARLPQLRKLLQIVQAFVAEAEVAG
nr:hypothetical protein [uncultured Holophaga sp.]